MGALLAFDRQRGEPSRFIPPAQRLLVPLDHRWVLAATGFLWIAVAVLRAVRRTLSLNTSRVFPEALAAGAIVAWCWVQANFENFFFLDYRIGFLLAATFGWVAARLASPTTQ